MPWYAVRHNTTQKEFRRELDASLRVCGVTDYELRSNEDTLFVKVPKLDARVVRAVRTARYSYGFVLLLEQRTAPLRLSDEVVDEWQRARPIEDPSGVRAPSQPESWSDAQNLALQAEYGFDEETLKELRKDPEGIRWSRLSKRIFVALVAAGVIAFLLFR